ncbi:MAG: hypothetical protein A2Y74_09865 [Actinobacteria bacterium RBG_13_63_9]|nr:MAG: hypothetical protein A2Y74_09865 [Actinobacteria bacterium RBG_13_63_9]
MAPAVSRTAAVIRKSGLWDLALIVVAFVLYYLVRGAAIERAGEATSRAIRLLELEKSMGLFWETQMQAWVMSSEVAVGVFNGIYVWAHFPLVAAIGLWLFFFHRRLFILFRNAFLISGGIGLIIFNLYPMAPPRLLFWGYGLIDTVAAYSPVNYDMQPAAFVNQYAAMPSLHFGWNLLLGVAIFCATKNLALRAFAIVMPIAMAMAVVVTGNHFILDVVAGTAVALFGLWMAALLDRHGHRIWTLVVPQSLRRAEA